MLRQLRVISGVHVTHQPQTTHPTTTSREHQQEPMIKSNISNAYKWFNTTWLGEAVSRLSQKDAPCIRTHCVRCGGMRGGSFTNMSWRGASEKKIVRRMQFANENVLNAARTPYSIYALCSHSVLCMYICIYVYMRIGVVSKFYASAPAWAAPTCSFPLGSQEFPTGSWTSVSLMQARGPNLHQQQQLLPLHQEQRPQRYFQRVSSCFRCRLDL
jgi:hypothetical protein